MRKIEDIIIAHRGESHLAPENTLGAINLAWENGIKTVEIDIQLTIDKEIVVIHDTDTLRTTGIKKKIKKSTLKELSSFDYGSYKSSKWKNEPIPTLHQALNTVPSGGKLLIEIKSDARILDPLKSELEKSDLNNSQIELIAFNVNTLARAKQMMPQYRMLWLLDLDYYRPYWMVFINKNRIIDKVKKCNLDGVNAWAGKILNRSFIEKFHKAGLIVYSWTINDPERARILLDSEINGIASDRPSWMVKQLDKY